MTFLKKDEPIENSINHKRKDNRYHLNNKHYNDILDNAFCINCFSKAAPKGARYGIDSS